MTIPLLPDDPHDESLRRLVKPPGWVNPTPASRYHLVVLGGGPAGLVCAVAAAGLGATVALVERDLLGGDCLNVGCVPSKSLLHMAKAINEIRRAQEFGVNVSEPEVDFAAVMERVRRVRAQLAPTDSAERFRSLGVDVFLGEGTFASRNTVEVNGAKLRFGRCVIATGSHAAIPDIPGLRESRWFTNETIFTLTELPKRLLVIGGGATGCELAQAFARLGSKVMIVTDYWSFLGHNAEGAGQVVTDALQRDGVEVWSALTVVRLEPYPEGGTRARMRRSDPPMEMAVAPWDEPHPFVADVILVVVGRQPNVEGLNLEAARVHYDARHGIAVNDFLRTSNRRVFAIGDVCLHGWKLTNAADAQARIAVRNALFPYRRRASALSIPYCLYTDPEIAHIGPVDGRRWKQSGRIIVPLDDPPDVFTVPFTEIDRAAIDGATGFVRVYVKKGTDRIVAATVVGPHASELIGALSVAVTNRVGLKALANTVFPYPSLTEAIRKVADQYNCTRLTPSAKWLIGRWLRWFR